MKEKIHEILMELNRGRIAVSEAQEQLLDLFGVSGAVCVAPPHIKPCRHSFETICQYNGHCNFKQTDR